MFPSFPLSDATLGEVRARGFPFEVDADAVARTQLERRLVPGPAGAPEVPLLIYRPKDAVGPLPAIYHIHGGGYVIGSASMNEAMHRPLVVSLDCAIVSVDYRLAPETRFPGAIEDAYAGLGWLFREAAAIGIDPERIGVMGESAGGGYAAALALLARDRGEYSLTFEHLVYPMLDDRTGSVGDPHGFAGEYLWTAGNNRYGWASLLGHPPGGEGVSPYAAAARAEDLGRLPPTFLLTGALDLFVEENLEYARRLLRAGVPTELHMYPGAIHGFNGMPNARIAIAARKASRDALQRFLHG